MAEPTPPNERELLYRVGLIFLVAAVLYLAQPILVPIALALLLAFLLAPMVTHVERLKCGRVVSVLIVVGLALAMVCTLGWIVERQAVEIAGQLPNYRASIRTKSQALVHITDKMIAFREDFLTTMSDDSAGSPARADVGATPVAAGAPPLVVRVYAGPSSIFAAIEGYLERLVTPIVTASLVFLLLIFLLIGREDVRARVGLMVNPSHSPLERDAFNEVAARVSRFLVAQSIINACFGVAAALGLWVIHLTLGGRGSVGTAITAGLLCGVFRFIPYIGTWIGASLPLLFTFAVYPDNSVFLTILAMFIGLELYASQVIEPRWLGASTGISPLGVVLSGVFWTWLWGPIGLLLSTPLTVILVVMGKYVPHLRFLHVLLADKRELNLPRIVSSHQSANPS